jgi:two-component sensor histidine kinase/ligand-binding sensor domain-containing protein
VRFLRNTIVLILVLNAGFVYSQLYHYERYDIENGLSQVHINNLFEDEVGFLWIATQGGGLNRFDGKQFNIYNEKDGVPGELVTSVTSGASGNVFVGSTWGGVSELTKGRFKQYAPAFSYSGTKHIISFKGSTWLASTSGLFWVKNKAIVKTYEKEIQSQVINYMTHDDKYLYALAYNKIFIIEPSSKTLYKTLNFELPTEANVILINKNSVYIGTKGSGIYKSELSNFIRLENNATLNFKPLNNNKNSKTNFIYKDEGGTIWAGLNDQRLYNIKDNELIENKKFSFQNNANFTSMLIDRSGTIWLGTDAIGLLKIINPIFINYSNNDFLNDPNLFSITSNEDNIWVGSRTNGILVYNQEKGELARLNKDNGFPNHINKLLAINNLIYACTNNGIITIDPKSFKQTGKTILAGLDIKAINIHSNGTIAIGTAGEGLFIIKPSGEIINYKEKSGFIHNYIHSLHIDKSNRLWIGTGNGLAFLNFENMKMTIIDNGQLCNTYVGCISEDKFGNIWFSTDRCLMKYDGMKFEKYDRLNGLISNTLYLVHCDNQNNVWVGSNAGINRLKLGSYGKVEKIDHFSMQDGFIGNECNSRGVYESPKGELFFCTIRGLIKYIGKEEFKSVCNHKIIISGLSVFYSAPNYDELIHDEVKKGTSLYLNPTFNHYQNHITFQYLCTEKCRPNDVSFSFKLENFDENWSPPTKTNISTYSNLPAGTYKFIVRTLDKNLEPTGISDSYSFTITAPFWLKPWFYITIAILFFGLLAFVKFRNEQRDEFQRMLLEKKVNQRTIELTKQKEERELLLKEIHHRVKNNLQIINSLINLQAGQVSDPESLRVFEECKNRIKSMAIIHTKFYESKDFSKIDLAEYVKQLVKDLIQTYNVNKNIELICNVNSIQLGIDTVIPVGLILNEIISNSLKYAFNKVEIGIIEISLKRNHDSKEFEMIVGDNGLGFDKAKFENSTNASLGFELIKILSEQLNGTVELLNQPGTFYKLRFSEIDKPRLTTSV